MKKIILHALLAVSLLTCGCSKWLDVQPSDRITSKVTFSTLQGFKAALNGVYIELNHKSLYGEELTHGFVDILVQPYNINNQNKEVYDFVTKYDYAQSYTINKLDPIWSKTYNLIANINLILKNCEDNRSVLSDDYYGIIKGEALALRAMLHFDLLRLFGPLPTEKNIHQPSIPYYTSFNYVYSDKERMGVFVEKVLADFEEATALIKPYDPIIENGTKNIGDDSFKHFRNLRMNYYAIRAFAARAYFYSAGLDSKYNNKAVEAALEVIKVQSTFFPFTPSSEMTIANENPDRICFKEIIFASQNLNASSNQYKFDFSSNVNTTLYTTTDALNSKIYLGEDAADYRATNWFDGQKDIGGKQHSMFTKFRPGAEQSLIYQAIPMIRVTEMYYIAAEGLGYSNGGLNYLKTVRNAKGLNDRKWTSSTFRNYLLSEYQREFMGEGQLFFYHKRKGSTSFLGADSGNKSFDTKKYVLPIPKDETTYINN